MKTAMQAVTVLALVLGLAYGGEVHAASVSCTPQAGYTHCMRVTYAGSAQTFTVPAGVTQVRATLWGAGGGGSMPASGNSAGGGAGGFAEGNIAVTPGATLTVTSGQGGIATGTTRTYGQGGAGGPGRSRLAIDNPPSNGSSGGGMSALWSGTEFVAANALIIAGGGGGSAFWTDQPAAGRPVAGAGGGTSGTNATSTYGGQGGTQTTGGAAGLPAASCSAAAGATAGQSLRGGDGCWPTVAGGDPFEFEGGGGGGGGRFGGGGGVAQNENNPVSPTLGYAGPGGGGSGYLGGLVSGGTLTAGAAPTYTIGATAAPPQTTHALYSAGVGRGGAAATTQGAAAGNGEVVIQWVQTRIHLSKLLPDGRVTDSDQFLLNIAGAGGPVSVTTTGSGSTATGTADLFLVTPGTSYTLSETAAGTAILSNYTTTYSCTNTRVGGIAPSGSGTSFSLTPAAGDDITCTFRNNYASSPFTCDSTLYLSQANATNSGVQLYRINRSTNPFTFPPVGSDGLGYNALGYNPADNLMYAVRTQTNNEGRRLFRINAAGTRTDLGLVANLPVPSATAVAYFAGAFTTANDNLLYVMDAGNGNKMYRINVVTRVATEITLSRNLYVADFDFANGLFYGLETGTGQLVSINPATGQVINLGLPGTTGVVGAFYADANGGLYGARNSGGFYKYDAVTGHQTRISDAPSTGGNDGARCPLGQPAISFDADLAITKTDGNTTYTPGTNVVYTISASNLGPFGAQNALVSDPLPTGITTASWTCAATSGGSVCRTAGGSGAINANVDLPVGAVATFTLTMAVPSSFTGNLVNVATIAPGDGNTDPVQSNNVATDTNTQNSRSNLSITKTNGMDRVTAGGTTTYTVVVTNTGPSAANGAVVRDDWTTAPGLNCSAGPVTCVASGTAGTQCPLPASLTPAALQSGIAVPALPSGGVVTFALTCAITATGQ